MVCSAHGQPYGITVAEHSLRWAAAEGVSEAVIAAICPLGEKSVDEIVATLSLAELGQVVNHRGAISELPATYGKIEEPEWAR